jgi:tannase
VNLTIVFCDPLDGRTVGIVARSDLFKLHFNPKSNIDARYSCPAASASPGHLGSPVRSTLAQIVTVSAAGVAVAQAVYDGLYDTARNHAYL